MKTRITAALATLAPQRVVMTAPGDWRVWQSLKAVVEQAGLALEICEDRHFYYGLPAPCQYCNSQ